MTKKDVKSAKEVLLELGMKETLISKLSPSSIEYLSGYAMDNFKSSEMPNNIVLLASMEVRGKSGACELASIGVATMNHIKALDSKQIAQVLLDYHYHQDAKIIVKMIRNMMIADQQEKLYAKTGGTKGEYYLDPKDIHEEM